MCKMILFNQFLIKLKYFKSIKTLYILKHKNFSKTSLHCGTERVIYLSYT